MTNFTSTERKIINLLYTVELPLSTSEIAQGIRISWKTANLYLKKLEKGGHVIAIIEGAAMKWRLREEREPIPPMRKERREKGHWKKIKR
jgi:Mn-dependent DtxR family transcriptional regulator